MEDAIAEAVKREVANYTGVAADQIQLEDRFESLGVGSLDALGLVADLEDEFEVVIDDDALRSIRTVGDAVKLIRHASGATE